MASAVVDEALQAIELLGEEFFLDRYPLKELLLGLRHMRTFLLFASKWDNDVRSKSDENTSSRSSLMLGSFLKRLEVSLIENGKNFNNLYLARKDEIDSIKSRKNEIDSRQWTKSDLRERALKLYLCINSFRQTIAEFYVALSNYHPLQSRDQSLEFIDSLQVNIADISNYCYTSHDPIDVESLRQKLLFFKNFIRFAQLRGCDPWKLQCFLTHLQVVAVKAAKLCHEWTFLPYGDQEMLRDEFQLKFSELLLKFQAG